MSITTKIIDENTVVINDSLKIVDNNGALEVVLLKQGAWGLSGSARPFSADRKFSIPTPINTEVAYVPNTQKNQQTISTDEATTSELPKSVQDFDDSFTKDPHRYLSWRSNGLTINDSVNKAIRTINEEIWWGFDGADKGDMIELRQAIRQKIKRGDGRDSCYKLAGKIKRLVEDEYFEGIPMSTVFALMHEGRINVD